MVLGAILGGVAGLASGVLGYKGQKDANKASQAQLAEIKNLYGIPSGTTAYGDLSEGLSGQQSWLQQALGTIQGSKANIADMGAGAKQQTLDLMNQGLGKLQSGMASKGLSSTTLGPNLAKGIYGETAKALSAIDAQIAQLYMNQASMEANMQQNIGTSLAKGGQAQAGLVESLGSVLQGVTHAPPPSLDLGGIATGVADIASGLGIDKALGLKKPSIFEQLFG